MATIDPLAEIVTLLKPMARFSKQVACTAPWRIYRDGTGEPFYCAILEGSCRIAFGTAPAVVLLTGDFVLAPAMRALRIESLDAPPDLPANQPEKLGEGLFHVGRRDGSTDLRMRIGHCRFDTHDAALLVSLLPDQVIVRDQPRLTTLIQLIDEEARAQRAAHELVLERLLEVVLIEAMRSASAIATAPSLARGLADERLAAALRAMHMQPERAWTMAMLAQEAALSRSAFFTRFSRSVGLPPMEYLLIWRMALAKQLLRQPGLGLEQVAQRVGYGSASAFSVAFARRTGMPPARYARAHMM
ncbi:AraC family transcriptional regulator [Acetobacter indonesiensis]|uniref:AraC family transcriptional regulator n=1 Tax=Acetobacter indonesiensis TaxID=104101 RepID=A0A252AMT2_9PROT|nr:AraC family transcriptional regulator [Acetobacter indonesiensis]OUI91054.1 AraC family transcriptional regulator [Acetobacter indonesiensis]